MLLYASDPLTLKIIAYLGCLALAVLALRGRHMGFAKANWPARLRKQVAKMLWRSDPIVPEHAPPERPSPLSDAYGIAHEHTRQHRVAPVDNMSKTVPPKTRSAEQFSQLCGSMKDAPPEEQTRRVREHFGVFGGARPARGLDRR
jgi:hypothetical protein